MAHLVWVFQCTSENLFVQKKEKIVLWRIKNKNCKDTTKSKDSIYKSENIFFSDAAHHTTSAQSEANRFIPLISVQANAACESFNNERRDKHQLAVCSFWVDFVAPLDDTSVDLLIEEDL